MAETFKISQFDGALLLRLEPTHEFANLRGATFLVELLFEFRGGRNTGQNFGLIFAAALALALEAQSIQCTISCHGQEPREERSARGVKLRGIAPKLEKYVLNHFFGSTSLLHHAQNQAINEAAVAIVELFKSAHIPL